MHIRSPGYGGDFRDSCARDDTDALSETLAELRNGTSLQENKMAMENRILASKKVALVTGGSRGIGKDIALSLARMGIGIVLTYRSDQTEGDRVAEEIQAFGGAAVALQSNLAVTSSFDTFLEQLKALLPDNFGTEKRTSGCWFLRTSSSSREVIME